MRYSPTEDDNDIKDLQPEPWMLDALKLNPENCGWRPDEDYMWVEGDGWYSRVIVPTWNEFSWKLERILGRTSWAASLAGHPVAKDIPAMEFAAIIREAIEASKRHD